MNESVDIPLNKHNNIQPILARPHRRVDLVALGVRFVLFDVGGGFGDEVEELSGGLGC
jgi:hypothetical protein